MSTEAMKLALEALEAVSMEMTVGERYTNAGQQVLDAIELLRVATTQQPTTTEPVAWNSIQIASWIGSQLMHEPSMFERAAVCKFVRSLGRHPTLLKHSPKIHPAPSVPDDVVRDAERYRWLKDRNNKAQTGVGCWEGDDHFHFTWLCDLDADEAIDAAMLAAK